VDETRTQPSSRMADSRIVLPPPPAPVGSYIPAVRFGKTIRTTGQLPFVEGELVATGTVGREVDVPAATNAARVAALNAVAAAADAAGGVDNIARVLALTGFIACESGFAEHPAVMNGASDLMIDVFGEGGRHVRTNVSAPALPLGSPVEIELLVECRE
jgi:enamine deaminase RidA (YjgF/YER057c/UK114 family)